MTITAAPAHTRDVPTPVLDELVHRALAGRRILSAERDPLLGVLLGSERVRISRELEPVFDRLSRIAIDEERRRIVDGLRAFFLNCGTPKMRDEIIALVQRREWR